MNKKRLILFVTIFILNIIIVKADDWCASPFEKISNDTCLLLNSGVKSRSHAKHVCNYFKSSLLYIENEQEQKEIEDFFSVIKRYRFNMQPYVWLDAANTKDGWVWSRNNKKNPADSIPVSPPVGDCGCFELSNSIWKYCDCATVQHYVCRKPKPNSLNKANNDSLKTNKTIEELNNLEREENAITISERILMDDEDKAVLNKTEENKIFNNTVMNDEKVNNTVMDDVKSNNTNPEVIVKDMKSFTRDSSDFINIYRKKVPVSIESDSVFIRECPNGYGFYLAKTNDCGLYKKCEYWNKKFSFITLNKCLDGKLFSFEEFICVPADTIKCDKDSPRFVPTE